jgi:hypothetical protein
MTQLRVSNPQFNAITTDQPRGLMVRVSDYWSW